MSYTAFEPAAQFEGVAGDVRDPYPTFHALREPPGVHRNPDGAWEIYPYDLVAQVMR